MIYAKDPVLNSPYRDDWKGKMDSIFFPLRKSEINIDLSECIRKLNETHSSEEVKKIHVDWKEYLNDREGNLRNIEEIYRQSMGRHGALVSTKYPALMRDRRLWMPGIALIATYLKAKKGLAGLFVCATKKALSEKIKEIVQSNKDERCALIVGSNAGEDGDFPLHKVCVCIEKTEKNVKVVFLDSFGSLNLSGSVFSEVQHSAAVGKIPVSFYLSDVQREFAGYGCAIFALQDAISFLQHPSFFEQIQTRTSSGKHLITRFPPGYMIGMQSSSRLEEYKKESDQLGEVIPGRKKTLAEYIRKNSVFDGAGKLQNQYITKKMLKYMNFIACAVRDLKTAELKELIHATLLT